MIQNFPKHVVIVPRGFSCWLQSSSPCSQLQRNSPLQCNLTQIDWFLEEAYFYRSLSFQALPQPQTCRLSRPAPEEGPVLPRLGTVSGEPGMGATAAVPQSIFRSDIFLSKGLKDSLRQLFISDPRCHMGSSWSGYPRRAGLHPLSARWVTETPAHIDKLNLRLLPPQRQVILLSTRTSSNNWNRILSTMLGWFAWQENILGCSQPFQTCLHSDKAGEKMWRCYECQWSDIFKIDHSDILGFELLQFLAKDAFWAYQTHHLILLL